MATSSNWITVTESNFPWEREALQFIRDRFPQHEPYRAWSNFEFIADDGSINEVDLLIFTPVGLFLIEIKSRPGRVFGDAGNWTWETDGKLSTVDNPLISANLKSKKLRSLLQHQKACQKKGHIPFIEPLVFCSAPDLSFDLQGNAGSKVCRRDRESTADTVGKPGILAALMRREGCPGLDHASKGTHDRPTAKLVSQAMEQAGIRPSQRHRKVNGYVLEQLIGEGPGYQDWRASHTQVPESKRRVRLYLVRAGTTVEDRRIVERAALREFQLLETLSHPGILRAHGYTEHEAGPALIFEHDPLSVRLDHYLIQNRDKLSIDARLELVRQIAEVISFAHDKKVVHRALSPQSILVTGISSGHPRLKIFNWQVGYRKGPSSAGASRGISGTVHVDRLVEDASTAYMAPEALSGDNTGEHLDVFSLGAIAYHLFSGLPPATNGLELSARLRETKGLQISSVLNGAGLALQYLIQYSTHPEVSSRTDSVIDFLRELDDVESELTSPDHDTIEDPAQAKMGDLLPGGYCVARRLGQGACSVALLVERHGEHFVLKVANDPENNVRIKEEAEVLGKDGMRHQGIVHFVEALDVGSRAAFLMRPVFADKDKKLIETLGQRLRKDGRLHVDLLERFGEDLLTVVNHLEDQGIPHRDIKPDNIAVGMLGRGDKLHLVLFDFSLSRAPAENLRAGTTGYLDPLLPLRTPPRWDLSAERYAAAVTLYELATGVLPRWGDGATDPSHLSQDTEITIEAELFDANLRDRLTDFFKTAFRRDIKQRFDNAEEMLRAWRSAFEGIDEPGTFSDHADLGQLGDLLAGVTFDTPIPDLGLGTRATNALDRANVITVEDLLTVPMRRLLRLRGVGNKTRREISTAVRILRDRLGRPSSSESKEGSDPEVSGTQEGPIDPGTCSIDILTQRALRVGIRESDTVQRAAPALLGLDPAISAPWPSQSDVAEALGVSRARIGQIVAKLATRWSKDPAMTPLRTNVVEFLDASGGIQSVDELAEALLSSRGSSEDEPLRSRRARAVARAAVEVERIMAEPRFLVRRDGDKVLVARSAELADYAGRLGLRADHLAREDPLVPPTRVLEKLREVSAPAAALPVTDGRLLRLAAAVSQNALVSSRQELYPRGMPAARALKLSQGALLGVRTLTVDQIRERVQSRYPESQPLPDPPDLDALLEDAGSELKWDATANNGAGCYVSPYRSALSVSSHSDSIVRIATSTGPHSPAEITPEEADANQFEDRLRRSIREGSFLTLMVNPKYHDHAQAELCRRFAVQLVDFEGVFLDCLRQIADTSRVDWNLVLQTDAKPRGGDWDKLMLLVGRTMTQVEERLTHAEKTMLMIYPGLLARYDQMNFLSRLSQRVGRKGGIPGLWLLVPGDHQAMLDGKPVPLIGPGQRVRIPESWIGNRHRG